MNYQTECAPTSPPINALESTAAGCQRPHSCHVFQSFHGERRGLPCRLREVKVNGISLSLNSALQSTLRRFHRTGQKAAIQFLLFFCSRATTHYYAFRTFRADLSKARLTPAAGDETGTGDGGTREDTVGIAAATDFSNNQGRF